MDVFELLELLEVCWSFLSYPKSATNFPGLWHLEAMLKSLFPGPVLRLTGALSEFEGILSELWELAVSFQGLWGLYSYCGSSGAMGSSSL